MILNQDQGNFQQYDKPHIPCNWYSYKVFPFLMLPGRVMHHCEKPDNFCALHQRIALLPNKQ
jgi:hypothetical protein